MFVEAIRSSSLIIYVFKVSLNQMIYFIMRTSKNQVQRS